MTFVYCAIIFFMIQNNHLLEVECQCGKTHVLDTIIRYSCKLSALFEFVHKYNTKSVFVIYQPNYLSMEIIHTIKILKSEKIKVVAKKYCHKHAELIFSSTCVQKAELIIAVGDGNLFEFAKYHSSMIHSKLAFVVKGCFFDYSFSKFARVYDGISFDFYVCRPPDIVIYACRNNVNKNEIKQYLLCKNLAIFENFKVVCTSQDKCCNEINENILYLYNKVKNKHATLFELFNICLKISTLMNFYGGTQYFYGAEMAMSGFVEMLCGKSFFDSYINAWRVVNLCYFSALESKLVKHNFNLNDRVQNISRILNVPLHKSYYIIKKATSDSDNNKHAGYMRALKYYLENYLVVDELLINKNIMGSKILDALYVTPEFCSSHLFINTIRDFGYLEQLLS